MIVLLVGSTPQLVLPIHHCPVLWWTCWEIISSAAPSPGCLLWYHLNISLPWWWCTRWISSLMLLCSPWKAASWGRLLILLLLLGLLPYSWHEYWTFIYPSWLGSCNYPDWLNYFWIGKRWLLYLRLLLPLIACKVAILLLYLEQYISHIHLIFCRSMLRQWIEHALNHRVIVLWFYVWNSYKSSSIQH